MMLVIKDMTIEGKQPAWKSIEYTISIKGLYHPKTQNTYRRKMRKNLIKNEYYKDDEGRYYYQGAGGFRVTNNEDGREDINED